MTEEHEEAGASDEDWAKLAPMLGQLMPAIAVIRGDSAADMDSLYDMMHQGRRNRRLVKPTTPASGASRPVELLAQREVLVSKYAREAGLHVVWDEVPLLWGGRPVPVVFETTQAEEDDSIWEVEGRAEDGEEVVVEAVPREWLPGGPEQGLYVFVYEQLSPWAEPRVVGGWTPEGLPFGMSQEEIAKRKRDAGIESALGDVSDIGWCANYLADAAVVAWELIGGGPGGVAEMTVYRQTRDDMRRALRSLVTGCAAQGWWPEEAGRAGLDRVYAQIPLSAMHARFPLPGLAAGADDDTVRRHVLGLWQVGR